jgi:hypothetical protein
MPGMVFNTNRKGKDEVRQMALQPTIPNGSSGGITTGIAA